MRWADGLPILKWGRAYDRTRFASDAAAAVIVTVMLIPQSLAYALLAGMPPQAGLYASILPLIAYAILGTSTSLAVGPVAVVSLMTAAAIGSVATPGTADYAAAAATLALMSGGLLVLMGLLRLGFIANFLSHPVVSGFVTASALIIAAGQLGPLFGIAVGGHAMPEIAASLAEGAGGLNPYTAALGLTSLAALLLLRRYARRGLARLGLTGRAADLGARMGPVAVVIATTLVAWAFDLAAEGVAVVGAIPQGMPRPALPLPDLDMVRALAIPAVAISLVGFVESVSVAQTLAAKRRERIEPDRELVGLGAANIASAVGGGFPVTGGFARSVVNFDAGAATPAAGALTAVGITLAALFLTPLLAHLPKAALAATIIVAVLSLVDLSVLRRAWAYSPGDFAAVATTLGVTLFLGVEVGIGLGVGVSVLLLLYRASRPHAAIVGRVPGTEHYRNVRRHAVETTPGILSIRVDESLQFANARFLEDLVYGEVANRPDTTHVILMCSAVNDIDLSALESLEAINERLRDAGVALSLSEVKGPVSDRLAGSEFLQHLTGRVYLTQHQAVSDIARAGGLTARPVAHAQ